MARAKKQLLLHWHHFRIERAELVELEGCPVQPKFKHKTPLINWQLSPNQKR